MTEQSQIIELSNQTPQQILQIITKLLQESDFQRFTLVVRRKPKLNESMLNSFTSKCSPQLPRNSGRLLRNSGSLQMRCISDISANNCLNCSSHEDSTDDALTVGLRLYDNADFDGALKLLLEEEEELRESLKEGAPTVKLYQDINFHIGNCYYRLKDYQTAVKYFGKSFEGEDARQRGQKFNNLGSCYAHLSQSRLSLKYYSQALKIYADYPDIDCSNLLNNLAMLYAQSVMFETAQRYFLKSIEERQMKSPDNLFALFTSYLHLGSCQKHCRKHAEAVTTLTTALSLAERGFGSESQTLLQLASIYEVMEKWNDALDCYEKLSRSEEQKGYLFQRAAHIHRFMGHFSDYDRFIQKACECYKAEGNQRKVTEVEPLVSRLKK